MAGRLKHDGKDPQGSTFCSHACELTCQRVNREVLQMKDEPPEKEFHLGRTERLANSFFVFFVFLDKATNLVKMLNLRKGFRSETDEEPVDGI